MPDTEARTADTETHVTDTAEGAPV